MGTDIWHDYDVAPAGRFITIQIGQPRAARPALVQNWFEELKRRVPTK